MNNIIIYQKMLGMAVIIVTILFSFSDARSDDLKNSFQFLSPSPGAELVSKETNIIIKPGSSLTCNKNELENLALIQGSISGIHTYSIYISDDNRTITLTPDVPFVPSETVTVDINNPIPVSGDKLTRTGQFMFYISAKSSPLISEEEYREMSYEGMLDLEGDDLDDPVTPQNTDIEMVLPADFPGLTISALDKPASGYVFIAKHRPIGKTYMMILDNMGKPIYYYRQPNVVTDFKVQLDTLLSFYVYNRHKFCVMDTTYTVIDSFACGNGYFADHHEFQLLPNGHAILIAYDTQSIDMSRITEEGQTDCRVTGLIIQELDPSKQVVFQWRSWDHIPITDVTHADLSSRSIDYIHGNAVELDDDGNYLLSSRHLDEITKINRQTGEIIWRLGGKNNMFEIVNDSSGFSRQHDIRRTDSGTITFFDNGNWHSPQFSRAVEYSLDTVNMVCELVWDYRYQPDIWNGVNGSVQRLPNGNTMIGWGGPSEITLTEVNDRNEKQFELSYVEGPDTWSYRSFRFPWSGTAKTPYLIAEKTAQKNIKLIFYKFGDDDVSKYYLYLKHKNGSFELADSTTNNYYILNDYPAGRTYTAKVTAINSNGDESHSSNSVSFVISGLVYKYRPGDINMTAGSWPPRVYGSDVTYLVNNFRGKNSPCLINGFFCAADINGDCRITEADITGMVSYLRGQSDILWCKDHQPFWEPEEDYPVTIPPDWPSCDE